MDKDNKLFMPNNIGSIRPRKHTNKKMVLGIATAILDTIILVFRGKWIVDNTLPGGRRAFLIIKMLVVVIAITLVLLDKVIINTKKAKKEYIKREKKKVTDISEYWNIGGIQENGEIIYLNGITGIAINLNRGYCYGRPSNFKNTHYEGFSSAISYLLSEGYAFSYYSFKIGDANIKPIGLILKKLQKLRETRFFQLAYKLIKYMVDVCNSSPSEEEYLFIYSSNSASSCDNILNVADRCVNLLYSTLYENSYICRKEDLIKFFCGYYGIDSIDINAMMRGILNDRDFNIMTITKEKSEELVSEEDIVDDYIGEDEKSEIERLRELYK